MSHIGVNLGFGNLHEKLTDEQMYAGELGLAELADQLGYDSLWSTWWSPRAADHFPARGVTPLPW